MCGVSEISTPNVRNQTGKKCMLNFLLTTSTNKTDLLGYFCPGSVSLKFVYCTSKTRQETIRCMFALLKYKIHLHLGLVLFSRPLHFSQHSKYFSVSHFGISSSLSYYLRIYCWEQTCMSRKGDCMTQQVFHFLIFDSKVIVFQSTALPVTFVRCYLYLQQ